MEINCDMLNDSYRITLAFSNRLKTYNQTQPNFEHELSC